MFKKGFYADYQPILWDYDLYWRDHCPPHFHAKYQDDEAVIDIETGVVTGDMSVRALRLIEEWRLLHTDELRQEWQLAEQNKALFRIEPLE